MAIGLQQPRVRYLVETVTMVILIVVAYFSVTTINALPRTDESLTRGNSTRSRVAARPDSKAGASAPVATARVAASAIMSGFVPTCGPKDPACDIRLTDVALADARPETVRAMLASLASSRCATRDFRSFVDNGYGQFHRLYSNDDRYLGVIFVDGDICARSPLTPGDAAIWPAPGVIAAHALQPNAGTDRKAGRAAPAERALPSVAAGERAAEPGTPQNPRTVWEEPRPARCVSKPVMTDVELARCRMS